MALDKEDGIAMSYEAAKVKWRLVALSIIRSMPSGTKFTTAQLWIRLEEIGILTRENRAMGGLIRSAKAQGLITTSWCHECGQEIKEPTEREKAHSRTVPVYTRS